MSQIFIYKSIRNVASLRQKSKAKLIIEETRILNIQGLSLTLQMRMGNYY